MGRMLRNALAIGGILALFVVAIPQTAAAENANTNASNQKTLTDRLQRTGQAAGYRPDTSDTTLAEIVGKIIYGATGLLGVIFVAQMVYAGYLWMTASGEEEQITKAKHIIRRSIVGLAIVLAAWAITFAVLQRLYAAAGPAAVGG